MDSTKKKGVIYILTNPSFPEFVKIGYADCLENRLKQLNKSEAVPYAFRSYAIYEVDRKRSDRKLHKLIDSLNDALRTKETFDGKVRAKEFYKMSAEKAYSILEGIATISGTQDNLKRMAPEGHEVLNEQTANNSKKKTHKPRLTFSEYGIPVGAQLVYINDSSVVATVLNDKKVEYKGQPIAMSELAHKLLGYKHSVQGPKYFTYNGKLLTDIRKQVEKNKS